ncbi:MAG: sensor histidine kinase [Alphaproteobacteria bacterium]
MSNPAKADEVQANESLPAAGEEERSPNGRQIGFPPGRQSGGRRFAARWADLSRFLTPRSPTTRYGLALVFAVAAYVAAILLEVGTGKFAAFPFYAAVVAGAWLGVGPGLLSFALSAVAAADFWTKPRYTWEIEPVDLPSFAAFVVFALMSLAWSIQRRRAQHALETTVQERTAELVRANAALKAEMAEREATERALREAEAELARTLRLATMAELAATIAHEINQPLAAITANGSACLRSLQRDPPLLDNAREAASCIVADGHRAGDVIARIRALFNKEPPRQQLLNLNEIVEAVLALSRGAIERQRVTVRAEPADPPPLVRADPVQLQQVLVNLVTNALEAMEDTPEDERVMTVRSRIEGDTAAVTVEDNGAGLDPDRVAHMFDSFYTTKPGGIGVGLAISRSIVDAHGGSMWATPGTPVGAVVGFNLPLAVQREHCLPQQRYPKEYSGSP